MNLENVTKYTFRLSQYLKINFVIFILDVQNFGDLSDNPSPEELAAVLKGNLQNAAAPGNLNFSMIIPFKHSSTNCHVL